YRNVTGVQTFAFPFLSPYVMFTFVIYIIFYNFYSGRSSGLFDEAQQINKLLKQFRPVLLYLEKFRYQKESLLSQLCEPFHKEKEDRKASCRERVKNRE